MNFRVDPRENYAGVEHSLRSFAAITGRVGTARSPKGALSAGLSPEVTNVGKSFAMVLGIRAIVITLEDYNLTSKFLEDHENGTSRRLERGEDGGCSDPHECRGCSRGGTS